MQRADLARPCPLCRQSFSGVVKIVSRDGPQVFPPTLSMKPAAAIYSIFLPECFHSFWGFLPECFHSLVSRTPIFCSQIQVRVEPVHYVYALPPEKPPGEDLHETPTGAELSSQLSSGLSLLEYSPGLDWRPLPVVWNDENDARQERGQGRERGQGSVLAEDGTSFGQVLSLRRRRLQRG